MKTLLAVLILMSSIAHGALFSQATDGYYCQVDVKGTLSGYYDIYYRMTKTEILGVRTLISEVDAANANLLSIESRVSHRNLFEEGNYFHYTNIMETSGILGVVLGRGLSEVEIKVDLPALSYNQQAFLDASINGNETSARCRKMDSNEYREAIQ